MKLIDKRGRLFGINIIDITIVLLVLFGAAAAYSYFNMAAGANGKPVDIRYEIEFVKQSKTFADSIELGDIVADAEKNIQMGTVSAKKVSPSVTVNPDLVQGKYVKSEIPDSYDVVITVEAHGLLTEKDILIDSLKIITGKELIVKGKGFSGNAFILGIQISEE